MNLKRCTWLAAAMLLAASAAAEPVRLVTGDGMPPHVGRALPQYGMLSEVVQRAFALAGRDTTLDWAPWKRGYELTKHGEYDATFPYARTPEREKEYLYSGLLYGGIRGVYVRPGSGIDPARPETFRGTYCVPLGFIVYRQIEELVARQAMRLERPATLDACAKMLALGRVDFFIADSISGDAAVRKASVAGKVVRLPKPFEEASFYLIVPRNRPGAQQLVDEFNAGLKKLKASGEHARIIGRHLR